MSTLSEPPTSDLPPFHYIHSTSFVDLLAFHGISLFVSTYQAGRLMVVQAQENSDRPTTETNGSDTHPQRLSTLLRNFSQLMGIALTPHRLAIGTRNQIHFFRNIPTATPYPNVSTVSPVLISIAQMPHFKGSVRSSNGKPPKVSFSRTCDRPIMA